MEDAVIDIRTSTAMVTGIDLSIDTIITKMSKKMMRTADKYLNLRAFC